MASLAIKMIADVKRAKKIAEKTKKGLSELPRAERERSAKDMFQQTLDDEADTIERVCEMLEDPNNRYANAVQRFVGLIANRQAGIQKKQSYMITIRPDDKKIDFPTFMIEVEQFVKRKCFLNYVYSFEQKGTDPMSLGSGFHVHIVADMKQRSKSEVLRDTLSSWKSWIDNGLVAANCIDVVTTKNAEALVQNYLIDYTSDDDHKEVTKSWDEMWRSGCGIDPLYTSYVDEPSASNALRAP